MKLIIDIPEEMTEAIKFKKENGKLTPSEIAILNGIPLPKGHGRLKDEDEIIKAIEDRVNFLKENDAVFIRLRKDIDILGCIPKIRTEVPTIIEADKKYEAKVITRGNCMICGKELTEGLFLCKKCEDKASSRK